MSNPELILLLVQMLMEERNENNKLRGELEDKRENSKWFLHNDKKKESMSVLSFFVYVYTYTSCFFMSNPNLLII